MQDIDSNLQAQLDAITTSTRGLVQPERLAITDIAVQELLASGVESRVLPVGAQAPSFNLQDALTGKRVHSADLLALGPLVVKFFRGRWCPYCMTELEAWQRLYLVLRERGALLVAISPQMQRQNDFTVQQHELAFPVLSDPGAHTAAAFGAAYSVPDKMRAHYRSILINIPFIHGDQGEHTWRLPVPATFVLSSDGKVIFSEAHADHRVRPEPQDVLNAL
ncbi:redoxin domain-containing protein [Granulicella sp. 5B5]|uniref:peroxiredoxin-like family protein n=1 Tax=Granulicella sp. 5B5 TaxID=1617967 RepID=UPI0015F64E80|nr:peroxiredoxin-like family protein [Granulicella sp. 5B5]QMV20025.1 redoxin domain-containing protein [Granulicella sp. 5B5]